MPRTLPRQILLFLLVGGLQVLLDWMVFVALTSLGLHLAAGNVVGRISGACLGFWLSGRYTFAREGHDRLGGVQLRRFLVAWLLITALSTLLLLGVARHFDLQLAWIAKPAVEALMAAIGFVVWRQWVFR